MKSKDYIKVIRQLNEELDEEDCLYNVGDAIFKYTTNDRVNSISFMNNTIYSSDLDDEAESKEELVRLIKEKLVSFMAELSKFTSSNLDL